MSLVRISTATCLDYDEGRIRKALDELLEPIGGMSAFVRPGMRVLLKPNLIHGTPPERGATTHPAVLKAVVEMVRTCGGQAVVGESPGYQPFAVASKRSGLLDVIDRLKVDVASFADTVDVQLGAGHLVPSLPLAREAVEADLVINLPKLKSHGLVLYTGCVKNMFGVISGAQKAGYHLRFQDTETFSRLLAEVYGAVRPGLNILDGIIGMDGNGPRNGDPAPMGVLIAGADGVAVDAVACAGIGLGSTASAPVRIAARMGLGTADLEQIEILGSGFRTMADHQFHLPHSGRPSMRKIAMSGHLGKVLRGILIPRPSVRLSGCKGCRICVQACPAKAITLRGGVAVIDASRCIRCYCCQELCEHGAIHIVASPIARILRGR